MATKLFNGINSVNDFKRGPPKENSCQVGPNWLSGLGREDIEKKKKKYKDGRLTQGDAKRIH